MPKIKELPGNFDLSSYKLSSKSCDGFDIPDTIYYVPNFIDLQEEATLIANVLAAPKPKWTYLSNRSLQNWGGLPHAKGMIVEPLPPWLKKYTEKLAKLKLFGGSKEPNHVLMNRYEPGQGIMAHEDGPLFFPTVTTINAGSHTILNFYKKITSKNVTDGQRKYCFSLLLWPKSLLVLQHRAYTAYLHEIEECAFDQIYLTNSDISFHDDPDNRSMPPKTKQIVNLDKISRDELCEYSANTNIESMPKGDEDITKNDNIVQLQRETRYSFTIRYVPKVIKNFTL